MSEWVNNSAFVRSVRGPDGANPVKNISGQGRPARRQRSGDELVHARLAADPHGHVEQPPADRLGPFVTTRGAAYCYLPSITALRVLSA